MSQDTSLWQMGARSTRRMLQQVWTRGRGDGNSREGDLHHIGLWRRQEAARKEMSQDTSLWQVVTVLTDEMLHKVRSGSRGFGLPRPREVHHIGLWRRQEAARKAMPRNA